MKLDVFNWEKIDATKEHEIVGGRLLLNLSAPAVCYVACQGYEVLAGAPAASFDLSTPEECTFRLEGPKGLVAFRYTPEAVAIEETGERFTNSDRMPLESGSVAEVKKALRLFHIERNAMLADMRAEQAALRSARAAVAPAPAQAVKEEIPAKTPAEEQA